ncbi:MAG: PadR family transcriptional regulator [Treponemataceae bacterium]|nr:PadR family transcriptional regulator [Treponemataceae bacterium]
MTVNTGIAMLDAVVLSVVAQENNGTYGYKITQDVRNVMDISESTLYPILRRLQKDGCLETYDQECAGRNRRYYKITSNGMLQLDSFRQEWIKYRQKIDHILMGQPLDKDEETPN